MTQIILPMGVLAIWTLMVLTLVPIVRVRATVGGRTHVKDYRYGESGNVPGDVSLANRHYMNLLELPVLFYVACLTLLAANLYDETMLWLAWAFVVVRIAHSFVHLTYNNVLHRLAVFATGALIVLVMWVRLVWWVKGRV
jgi:hypothetical protein